MPVKVVDRLNQQLFDLAQQMPQHAATAFIERLEKAQTSYKEQLSVTSQYPDIKSLMMLRSLGHVFPTSDFSHPVVTPALLYMTEILAQGEIRSEIDIGRGLFLIQLLHDVCYFLCALLLLISQPTNVTVYFAVSISIQTLHTRSLELHQLVIIHTCPTRNQTGPCYQLPTPRVRSKPRTSHH